MNTLLEVKGRTLYICLKEDLDHHIAEYIRKRSDELLEQYPVNKVLFDFTGVEFMDSSGIGVVMGRYKQMQYAGGVVYIYGIGNSIARIFEMSGLYRLVKEYRPEQEGEL